MHRKSLWQSTMKSITWQLSFTSNSGVTFFLSLSLPNFALSYAGSMKLCRSRLENSVRRHLEVNLALCADVSSLAALCSRFPSQMRRAVISHFGTELKIEARCDVARPSGKMSRGLKSLQSTRRFNTRDEDEEGLEASNETIARDCN